MMTALKFLSNALAPLFTLPLTARDCCCSAARQIEHAAAAELPVRHSSSKSSVAAKRLFQVAPATPRIVFRGWL